MHTKKIKHGTAINFHSKVAKVNKEIKTLKPAQETKNKQEKRLNIYSQRTSTTQRSIQSLKTSKQIKPSQQNAIKHNTKQVLSRCYISRGSRAVTWFPHKHVGGEGRRDGAVDSTPHSHPFNHYPLAGPFPFTPVLSPLAYKHLQKKGGSWLPLHTPLIPFLPSSQLSFPSTFSFPFLLSLEKEYR